MIDLFLRFASETEALAVFEPLNMVVEDGDGVQRVAQAGFSFAAMEVGTIPDRDGWHVNVRVIDPAFDTSPLEPFRVYPAAPVCVWA